VVSRYASAIISYANLSPAQETMFGEDGKEKNDEENDEQKKD
jgi:hypothetical protein